MLGTEVMVVNNLYIIAGVMCFENYMERFQKFRSFFCGGTDSKTLQTILHHMYTKN